MRIHDVVRGCCVWWKDPDVTCGQFGVVAIPGLYRDSVVTVTGERGGEIECLARELRALGLCWFHRSICSELPESTAEYLGCGPGLSQHVDGQYAILRRVDGEWHNMDGLARCDPPEQIVPLDPYVLSTVTPWWRPASTPPVEDLKLELVGYGTRISSHRLGRFAVMRYDGDWWNEDGTELCAHAPEHWAYIRAPGAARLKAAKFR